MKKIISIIIAVLLISSCFAIGTFAEDVVIGESDTGGWTETTMEEYGSVYYEKQPIFTFSEDFKKMYVDDEQFSRFDISMLSSDFGYSVQVDDEYNPSLRNSAYVDLTDVQKETVSNIFIKTNSVKTMYRIELYFTDGSNLTIYFLQDTYFDDYNKVVSGEWNEYVIDFEYPTGNTVTAQKSDLFGEAVVKNDNQLSMYDWYPVKVQNSDKSLVAHKGFIFIDGDEYYYLDSAENKVEGYYWYETGFGDVPDFTVHKITDEALIAELAVAEQRYYDDDYGYLYNDDTTDTVSAVFLIFVFAVVPFIILVIFLVKAIRGKGIYQKIYGAVAALCVAELAVFTIIAVIISNLN